MRKLCSQITTVSVAAAFTALCGVSAGGAEQTAYPTSEYLFGNWLGVRDQLFDRGVDFQVEYKTEPMANVAGGEETGITYTHNLAIDTKFDFEQIYGWENTSFLVRLSQRAGRSVSRDHVAPSELGNTFTVQEIFGGQTFKVVNVQLNTLLLEEKLSLAAGRLFANDDFLRSPLYCQFVNNSFCGSQKSVFLQDPSAFTAYPSAQWGIRARYDTDSRDWSVLAAVYDGDVERRQGDPTRSDNNRHGTNWDMGGNGATFVGAVHYHVNRDSDRDLNGVYKVGGYYMTGNFRDIGETNDTTNSGSAMMWVLADQMIYREQPGSPQGLWAFGGLVFSLRDDVNPMTEYFGAGLVYEGLIPGRPRDKTGMAFSIGWFSGDLNDARRAQNLAEKDFEAVFELNHNFVVGRGIELQPDFQYLIKPAGTGDIDDAFLLGGKAVVRF